jgi:PAS domain S-box-containing protein
MSHQSNQVLPIQEFMRLNSLEKVFENYQNKVFPTAFIEQMKIIEYPNQFFYIVDVPRAEIVYISKNIENVLGYSIEDINIDYMYNQLVHPEDYVVVMSVIKEIYEYVFTHKTVVKDDYVVIDYRIKKKDGNYIWLLRQSTALVIMEDPYQILYSISTCTDYTELKQGSKVNFLAKGPNVPIDYFSSERFYKEKFALTPRRIEILKLLDKGFSSNDIANFLKIKKNTVDTHRRQILQLTNTSNTPELLAFVKEYNLI